LKADKPLIFTLLILIYSSNAFATDGITLANDYIIDIKDSGNHRTFQDKSIRIDYENIYITGYLGNFQHGAELGGYVKDFRRSVYNAQLRIRSNDQTYQIGTEQLIHSGFVGRLELRYIHVEDLSPPDTKGNLFVYGIGFDKYYGDYNYFSATYYNDPRESGRFSIVLQNTIATRNSFFRLGIVPRNDGTIGYFATVKYHWVFVGYAFTKEFDFTTLDRRVITFGAQIPFNLRWTQGQ
jgi:hypothetical protein